MNNALLYCVNNDKWNKTYLHQMMNSINSFYHHNPKTLLDTITVFILTDKKDGLDLSKLKPEVKYVVIEESEFSYDYSHLTTVMAHLTYHTYFRFEMFNNPIFKDFDNLAYIDCDTEFNAPMPELFIPRKVARICMVNENQDWLKINHNIECPLYCNAGFILYTPKAMDTNVSKDLFNALIVASTTNKFTFSDQDALNFTLKDKKFGKYLMIVGESYNSFLGTWKNGEPKVTPKMVHHAGNQMAKSYLYKYI